MHTITRTHKCIYSNTLQPAQSRRFEVVVFFNDFVLSSSVVFHVLFVHCCLVVYNCIWVHICIYTHVYTCTYVCIYMYIHTYTYMYIRAYYIYFNLLQLQSLSIQIFISFNFFHLLQFKFSSPSITISFNSNFHLLQLQSPSIQIFFSFLDACRTLLPCRWQLYVSVHIVHHSLWEHTCIYMCIHVICVSTLTWYIMYMVYYEYTHEPYVFVGAHVHIHMYTHNMCINIDMVYDVYGVL